MGETIYKTLDEVASIEFGTRVVKSKVAGTQYPVYGGGGETFRIDSYNRENRVVVGRFALSKQCTRFVSGKFFLNDSGLTVKTKDETVLIQDLLDKLILYSNDLIYNLARGAGQKNLNINDFKELKISFPLNIEEQQRIVNILDKAEEIRTKKKLANEKLDEFLKSTFIDMFGDPVINSKQLPKVKLSDMGTLARGKSKHRPRNAPELLNGHYPLIQTGDVANSGLYLKTYNQTYSEMGLKQSKMWKAGTLCITIAANIAKTSILTFDACFPDSIVGFTNSDKCSIHYIQFWLMFLQAVLEAEAPQSAQKNINLEILNSLELPYPPIEQQNQFAQIVQKVEAQKEKNQKVIEQMDNLFNSLMQQAFNK